MIISPPEPEERIIKVKSLRRNRLYKASPLAFDITITHKGKYRKQTYMFSLTMKEAIKLHRELGRRVRT